MLQPRIDLDLDDMTNLLSCLHVPFRADPMAEGIRQPGKTKCNPLICIG